MSDYLPGNISSYIGGDAPGAKKTIALLLPADSTAVRLVGYDIK